MRITIRRGIDCHVHFRDDAMLEAVVPHTASQFRLAVVMPNVPAIETGPMAFDYWRRIRNAAKAFGLKFSPKMTIKLTERTTPSLIEDAAGYSCVVAAKLYPQGVTTGSTDGIKDVEKLSHVFEAMQRRGLILCVHAESPDPNVDVYDREKAYLDRVNWIVRNFPGMKVVLEHITTKEAVDFVRQASVNVAATITAHHVWLDRNDVLGHGLKPHYFCYPVPKRGEHRNAVASAALLDDTGRFFFGSDSAPHYRAAKESACGCAGVYSAPVAMSMLAELFLPTGRFMHDDHAVYKRDALERFVATNGAKFYGVDLDAEDTITLGNDPEDAWTVPDEIDGVVPFKAGEKLNWRVMPTPEPGA